MSGIGVDVRDILVFHLGVEEARLTVDARLAEDLGADRLDIIEIAMSCEEKFDMDIPNHVATGLATVGDVVRLVETQVAGKAVSGVSRPPVRPGAQLLFGEALQSCLRAALRLSAIRGVFERPSSGVPSA